jgi:hypothetical protein
LIMQVCDNDKAFHHYKRREVQLNADEVKHDYYTLDQAPTSRSHGQTKSLRMHPDEIQRLRKGYEDLREKERRQKIERFRKFKLDRE